MKRRLIFIMLLCPVAALCVCLWLTSRHGAQAAPSQATLTRVASGVVPAHSATMQTTRARQRPRRNTRRANSVRRASNSFTNFSHDSASHGRLACAACHRIESASRIDVVEYPDHDSCLGCHKQQFFNGARPNICTICHTVVSPRDGSRFAFPKPAAASEFANIFPHDKHQYVIASVAPAHRTRHEARFIKASFSTKAVDETAFKPLESCATCHATDTTARPAPAEWIEDKELDTPGKIEPVPTAGTFKLSPTGHAACFICHFQQQQPIATNCAGCHGLAAKISTTKTVNPHSSQPPGAKVATQIAAPTVASELKVKTAHTPDVWLERISAKFRHEREDHKGFSCTSCHTNILEATSLADLAAEVPLATCSGCHAGTRKDIQKEMDKVKADPKFNCAYCHASNVGSRDIPASHFAVVGRTQGQPRAGK